MNKPNNYIGVKKYISLCPKSLSDQNGPQRMLISEWCQDLQKTPHHIISDVHMSFRGYSFNAYPDQDKLKAYIRTVYTNSEGEIYWAGTLYKDYETLYKELSEQKYVLELVVDKVQTDQQSTYCTNCFGCSWCDGVGVAPDGTFCGECTNIDKEYCAARSNLENEVN